MKKNILFCLSIIALLVACSGNDASSNQNSSEESNLYSQSSLEDNSSSSIESSSSSSESYVSVTHEQAKTLLKDIFDHEGLKYTTNEHGYDLSLGTNVASSYPKVGRTNYSEGSVIEDSEYEEGIYVGTMTVNASGEHKFIYNEDENIDYQFNQNYEKIVFGSQTYYDGKEYDQWIEKVQDNNPVCYIREKEGLSYDYYFDNNQINGKHGWTKDENTIKYTGIVSKFHETCPAIFEGNPLRNFFDYEKYEEGTITPTYDCYSNKDGNLQYKVSYVIDNVKASDVGDDSQYCIIDAEATIEITVVDYVCTRIKTHVDVSTEGYTKSGDEEYIVWGEQSGFINNEYTFFEDNEGYIVRPDNSNWQK